MGAIRGRSDAGCAGCRTGQMRLAGSLVGRHRKDGTGERLASHRGRGEELVALQQ